MLGTARLLIETIIAVATMATFAAIAGFAAGAITGDRMLVIGTIAVVFVLTGFVLVFRLWWTAKSPVAPVDLDG